MNNEVKDGYGNVIGFRCNQCYAIVPSMWGTTCNRCRHENENLRKQREEIARLTKVLNDLNTQRQ